MNERIDRIPRQPRIKLVSPPSDFLWAMWLYSSYLRPWEWVSAHGGREKLLSVPHTQKQHPSSLLWVTFSFPTVKNWSDYQERHTGTVERRKSLSEIFFFSQVAPLFGLESRAALPTKRQWWALMIFPCWQWFFFPNVGWIYLVEGSAAYVPLNTPKGILSVHCVQDPWSVLSMVRLEMPAESQSRWCHIDVFATILVGNLI